MTKNRFLVKSRLGDGYLSQKDGHWIITVRKRAKVFYYSEIVKSALHTKFEIIKLNA